MAYWRLAIEIARALFLSFMPIVINASPRFNLYLAYFCAGTKKTVHSVSYIDKIKKSSLSMVIFKNASKRSFKTRWFARQAKKYGITDIELCNAVKEAIAGQAEDLGGGVWKKRLNKNMDRSILLAKGSENWIYVYLFSKSATANIKQDELKNFKELAAHYGNINNVMMVALLDSKELTEICNDCDQK